MPEQLQSLAIRMCSRLHRMLGRDSRSGEWEGDTFNI